VLPNKVTVNSNLSLDLPKRNSLSKTLNLFVMHCNIEESKLKGIDSWVWEASWWFYYTDKLFYRYCSIIFLILNSSIYSKIKKRYAGPASHSKLHASIEEGSAGEQTAWALLPGKPLPIKAALHCSKRFSRRRSFPFKRVTLPV
jgi:hypothetical protein